MGCLNLGWTHITVLVPNFDFAAIEQETLLSALVLLFIALET